MHGARLFSRWLQLVASLRFLSVVIGIYLPDNFKTTVFTGRPDLVNPLLGRLFSCWTLITCALCLVCAHNPSNKAIYGTTLLSFLVALLFFSCELLVYRTVSLKSCASPLVVASVSSLWMVAGWNYYTTGASGSPPATDKRQ